MQRPQAAMLPDGKRLHLQHGPIDLIVEAFGTARHVRNAYHAATQRFETVLQELVAELATLRKETHRDGLHVSGVIAQRMEKAVRPYWRHRVTPMAAVAGSVAQEILRVITDAAELNRAFVNNGGDIAIHLAAGERFAIASPSGKITVTNEHSIGGIATSGWRGRSFSLGIADAVTVLAGTASEADVAATLIANAVNLPDSVKIKRTPACELAPDSDLGQRLVTTGVAQLSCRETDDALARGYCFAQRLVATGQIISASLMLQRKVIAVPGAPFATSRQESLIHA